MFSSTLKVTFVDLVSKEKVGTSSFGLIESLLLVNGAYVEFKGNFYAVKRILRRRRGWEAQVVKASKKL